MPIKAAKLREERAESFGSMSGEVNSFPPLPWKSILLTLLIIYFVLLFGQKFKNMETKEREKTNGWNGCLDDFVAKLCKTKKKYETVKEEQEC